MALEDMLVGAIQACQAQVQTARTPGLHVSAKWATNMHAVLGRKSKQHFAEAMQLVICAASCDAGRCCAD